MPPLDPRDLVRRNLDGYYNDLAKPAMGSSSDPELTDADSMYFTRAIRAPGSAATFRSTTPSRSPSRRCWRRARAWSARNCWRAASSSRRPSLNLLAAAWIQFETHDWFNHGEPVAERPVRGAARRRRSVAPAQCPMQIRRTRPDPTRDYEREKAANGGRAAISADLRQRRVALVGRLADLRQQPPRRPSGCGRNVASRTASRC